MGIHNWTTQLPGWLIGKESLAKQETHVQSLGWDDPLEKEMAIHCSTIAWKIPWTEELGRLQSKGLQRAGHDFTFTSLLGSKPPSTNKERRPPESCLKCGKEGPWAAHA